MKIFKITDLFISSILILVFIILNLTRMNDTFIYGYCIIVGWQVISMLVHAIENWFNYRGSWRRNYHYVVAGIIASAFLIIVHPYFFIVFYIMLFLAPLFAIFYTLLCWHEVTIMNKRPLAVLK